MINNQSPIAVFDSGMGGISVLKELYKLMPNENYIYFGDSINAPYGTKSTEEIRNLTVENVEMLIERGAKAVVIACNTATSAAAAFLRQKYTDIPIIGLEPALKPAVLSGKKPTVVVMATPFTLREEKFSLLLSRFENEADVIKLPAPEIVSLVESNKTGTDEMVSYLEEIFSPYDKSKIDCVVLGCTHFPFAKKDIIKTLGSHVTLFDGGEGAARQTQRLLSQMGLLNPSCENSAISFENSDKTKIDFSIKLFNSEI